MEKDKMLEQLFADFKPEVGGGDRFMAALERKLDAVEYLRQMQEAQLRRQRVAMLVVLALALAAGGVLFAVISRWPEGVPLFTFGSTFKPLIYLEHHERTIFLLACAALISYATISIANAVQQWDSLWRRVQRRQI